MQSVRIKLHAGRFNKLYEWLTQDEKLIKNDKLAEKKNMEILKDIVEGKRLHFPPLDYTIL